MDIVTLYKRAKNRKSNKPGKVQEWMIWIEDHDGVPCIMRKSGQQDGKQNTKKKYVKKGKNIGKANETTPYEQAFFEASNDIKKKLEDNMVMDIAKIDDPFLYLKPALASKMNAKKTEKLLKERGYLYVQGKLNGARCWKLNHLPQTHMHYETPTKEMMSRQLKPFTTIEHINKELEEFGLLSPDGEIFNPELNFQAIISLLKKFYLVGENEDYPELCTEDLQYHIYDLAIPGYNYAERKEILESLFDGYDGSILQPVPTHIVKCMADIEKWNAYYINLGYEGLIIRDPEELYAFNDRNESLMKYKKFFDEEFEIIGHTVEIWDDVLAGKMRNLVMWKCITKNGKEFTSRPKGSFLERERLYNVAEEQYGKMLTVRYQDKSTDGCPNMNVGISLSEGIRDYE